MTTETTEPRVPWWAKPEPQSDSDKLRALDAPEFERTVTRALIELDREDVNPLDRLSTITLAIVGLDRWEDMSPRLRIYFTTLLWSRANNHAVRAIVLDDDTFTDLFRRIGFSRNGFSAEPPTEPARLFRGIGPGGRFKRPSWTTSPTTAVSYAAHKTACGEDDDPREFVGGLVATTLAPVEAILSESGPYGGAVSEVVVDPAMLGRICQLSEPDIFELVPDRPIPIQTSTHTRWLSPAEYEAWTRSARSTRSIAERIMGG